MRSFVVSVSVDTLTLDAVAELTGLDFVDPADIAADPADSEKKSDRFVYVLVDPRGAVFYPGKAEAAYRAENRFLSYAKWAGNLSAEIQSIGRPDPADDPNTGDLALTNWSPIVRTTRRYGLVVKAAVVPDPKTTTAREWEARIQALIGTLTTIESLVGGSAWEANPGTLRGNAYEWARQRIADYRKGL